MKRAGLASLIVLILVGLIRVPAGNGISWSQPIILDHNPWSNLSPDITQTSTEEVWVAWQMKPLQEDTEIYLDIWNGFGWSGLLPLTNHPGEDITPAIAQLQNGTILLVWASERAGSYDLYMKTYNEGSWGPEQQLAQMPGNDLGPELLVRSNGELWLVWAGSGDIYYMKNDEGLWTGPTVLTISSGRDIVPSIEETKDGKIWVVWESDRLSPGIGAIFQKTWDGKTWSGDSLLAKNPDTGNSNKAPEIIQDRNGILRVLYTRERGTGNSGNPYQYDIYYKESPDNGASWTTDTPYRETSTNDEYYPAAAEAGDRQLWLVWSSDEGSIYGSDVIHLSKSDTIKTHDLSLGTVARKPLTPRTGETLTVTVQLKNLGDYTETATVGLNANTTMIGSRTLEIDPGETLTLLFEWNTTGTPYGRYAFKTTVTVVQGETVGNAADNTKTELLMLVPRGDITRDGIVSVVDLAEVGLSLTAKTGEERYDPEADLNRDGVIDILDFSIVGGDFAKRVA